MIGGRMSAGWTMAVSILSPDWLIVPLARALVKLGKAGSYPV
jgi:hypothetical protein